MKPSGCYCLTGFFILSPCKAVSEAALPEVSDADVFTRVVLQETMGREMTRIMNNFFIDKLFRKGTFNFSANAFRRSVRYAVISLITEHTYQYLLPEL